MKSAGLSALAGLICLLIGSSGSARPHRPSSAGNRWPVVSPDGRHRLERGAAGSLLLDGRLLASSGRPVGVPVWRQDSRALAFLQRSGTGLQLRVLLLDLDPLQPVVWSLPPHAEGLREVFWITSCRIGVGEKPLVPRLVVSWTTTVV